MKYIGRRGKLTMNQEVIRICFREEEKDYEFFKEHMGEGNFVWKFTATFPHPGRSLSNQEVNSVKEMFEKISNWGI